MQTITLARLAALIGARLVLGSPDLSVDDIALDTRASSKHMDAPRQLFIALRGERFDAHDFLALARQRGWRVALVEDEAAALEAGFEHILVVPDTLAALQAIARAHREQLKIPVVGITGSNGKTAVKELLASILSRRMTVYRSPGSYNSQVGVALSLLGIRPEHELAVIEAGISQPGEMAKLEQMIQPEGGALTHVGLAHIASLGSLEITAAEKLTLFDARDGHRSPWFLYPVVERQRLNDERLSRGISFGREGSGADVFISDERWAGDQVSFLIHDGAREPFEVSMTALAEHDPLNALVAAAMALRLGCTPAQIREGLSAWEPSAMRLEIHTTPRGVTLINDTYSADPSSALSALKALNAHSMKGQRKVAVLGSMLELGTLGPLEHQRLGRAAYEAQVDVLYCVGELARQIAQGAREAGMPQEDIHEVEGVSQLSGALAQTLRQGDVVLFKASRAVGLEAAAATILESFSPTRLTVDLGAIAQNFHAVRHRVGPEVKLMAVVKSYGYGNDATRVSKALVREGVDMLAVAYADEGVPLREAGLSLPILVMNTLAGEVDKIVRWGLTALLYSESVAKALSDEAQAQGVCISVHLKINTGMNRAGVSWQPERVVEFARYLQGLPALRLTGTMTHLAAADEVEHDDFTCEQLERFERALGALRDAGIDPGVVHAANTSAAWRFERASYDMVRLGLGLYGQAPSAEVLDASDGTRSALELTTQVIHTHQVEAGESVGYGRSWVASTPTRLATIAVGYSDGFPRAMSNGGCVLVHGVRCPVVGRVCMDVCVIDVSAVPTMVKVGDEVVLFGAQDGGFISIDELAARANTISYEILCNLSSRVRRVFVRL